MANVTGVMVHIVKGAVHEIQQIGGIRRGDRYGRHGNVANEWDLGSERVGSEKHDQPGSDNRDKSRKADGDAIPDSSPDKRMPGCTGRARCDPIHAKRSMDGWCTSPGLRGVGVVVGVHDDGSRERNATYR
jgi:hypothetical protein